jgi:hypothetical protein
MNAEPPTDNAMFDLKYGTRPFKAYDPTDPRLNHVLAKPKEFIEFRFEGPTPRSVAILGECMQLQMKKSQDYQNADSSVAQADYYPTGVKTLHEIVHAKMLRMKSLIETFEANPTVAPMFESLADSAKDAINYLSFLAAYCEFAVPGQKQDCDILNRKVTTKPLS